MVSGSKFVINCCCFDIILLDLPWEKASKNDAEFKLWLDGKYNDEQWEKNGGLILGMYKNLHRFYRNILFVF
jgi:hypothetical protein